MSTTTVPSSTEAMPAVLLEWKPIPKGSLRGFAAVRLGRSLVIRDLAILHSNGRAWVGFPGKPIISADGTVLASRETGGNAWVSSHNRR